VIESNRKSRFRRGCLIFCRLVGWLVGWLVCKFICCKFFFSDWLIECTLETGWRCRHVASVCQKWIDEVRASSTVDKTIDDGIVQTCDPVIRGNYVSAGRTCRGENVKVAH